MNFDAKILIIKNVLLKISIDCFCLEEPLYSVVPGEQVQLRRQQEAERAQEAEAPHGQTSHQRQETGPNIREAAKKLLH